MDGKLIQLPGETNAARQLARDRPTHRILVLDDESATRHLSSSVLTPCGYHVEAAEDIEAA